MTSSEQRRARAARAEGEVLVRVEGLSAGYGSANVLEGVDLEVRRGEILAVLGPSGCGKSTLLKHMIGLYAPRAGRVVFDGHDLTHAEGEERMALLRRQGATFQSGALFGSADLLANVRVPLEEHTHLAPQARDLVARMKLGLVGLAGSERKLPAEISGGMRKRAALARALALDPELVYLDEPAAGLDPLALGELDELLLELSRTLGLTFVVVTHELPSVFRIADRVCFLERSVRGILALGPPAELRDHAESELVRRFLSRGVPEARASGAAQAGNGTR